MNFKDVMDKLEQGIAMESEVSRTTYEMEDGNIFAEGKLVEVGYITEEEKLGSWREVDIIDSSESFSRLSDKQKEEMLENAMVYFDYEENRR